jgi:hypothetical protein
LTGDEEFERAATAVADCDETVMNSLLRSEYRLNARKAVDPPHIASDSGDIDGRRAQ